LRSRRQFDVLAAKIAVATSIDLTARANAISTKFRDSSRRRIARARNVCQAKSAHEKNQRTPTSRTQSTAVIERHLDPAYAPSIPQHDATRVTTVADASSSTQSSVVERHFDRVHAPSIPVCDAARVTTAAAAIELVDAELTSDQTQKKNLMAVVGAVEVVDRRATSRCGAMRAAVQANVQEPARLELRSSTRIARGFCT
jgi:hypothetical protein